jgi:hypothetical protein
MMTRTACILAVTIIDRRDEYEEWVLHVSQLAVAGEKPRLSDEDFLAECQRDRPDLELRIRPLYIPPRRRRA